MKTKLFAIAVVLMMLSGCASSQKLAQASCDFVIAAKKSDDRQKIGGVYTKDKTKARQQNVINGVISAILGSFSSSKKSKDCN